MKKISRSQAERVDHLVRRRFRRYLTRRETLLDRATSGRPGEIQIIPPEAFNLSRNYHETVSCLRKLKLAVHKTDSRQRVYVDFKPIRTISLAGAVVLAAEIDRWRRRVRRSMRLRDIEAWDIGVVKTLTELGFFSLLQMKLPVSIQRQLIEMSDDEEVTILPLVSGTQLAREAIAGLIKNTLNLVARVLEQDPSVYEALTEAVYNSTLHAYPKDWQFEFPPVKDGWWATGSWNPSKEQIRFWLYDQGVGIANTLPASKLYEQVLRAIDAISPLPGIANSESQMIRAALEADRTALADGHGQGLKDVIGPAERLSGTKVRILSGKGGILYSQDEGATIRGDETLHLGGTLIEWTIPIVRNGA